MVYLEGQGDLVCRLISPITRIGTLVIPMIHLLIQPPDPPSRQLNLLFRSTLRWKNGYKSLSTEAEPIVKVVALIGGS